MFVKVVFILLGVAMMVGTRAKGSEKLEKALQDRQIKITLFSDYWQKSGGKETANSQTFWNGLLASFGLPKVDLSKSDTTQNDHVFEYPVHIKGPGKRPGYADVICTDVYAAEFKQGSERPDDIHDRKTTYRVGIGWRGSTNYYRAIEDAKQQGVKYLRSLPSGRPPILWVVDTGYAMWAYENFNGDGDYRPLEPAPGHHMIYLNDLKKPEIQDFVFTSLTDPYLLDPSRYRRRVTEAMGNHLNTLAESLERDGHQTEEITRFLVRCIITFFAEDRGLIKRDAFTRLVRKYAESPEEFSELLYRLWPCMYAGGEFPPMNATLPEFGSKFFKDAPKINLSADQVRIILNAADAQWADVDPIVMSRIVERAIKPHERKKMGAFYTPPPYVERLVNYTIIRKLRNEWERVIDQVIENLSADRYPDAIDEIDAFHERLRSLMVLDPSSGCGNFLAVTLKMLHNFEAEVFDTLRGLGITVNELRRRPTVGPHQLRGIEVNGSAVAISELVILLTDLQQQMKIRGLAVARRRPVLPEFDGIEHRDAIIAWDGTEPILDTEGRPVTRWDGSTYTFNKNGIALPDLTASIPAMNYINARPAAPWPRADYIIGNPPYLGYTRIRKMLGEGYANALNTAYPNLRKDTDYVTYWVARAGMLVRDGEAKGFGFILTDKMTNPKNRRVTQAFLEGTPRLKIDMAARSHPWHGADVRVCMLSMTRGTGPGILLEPVAETTAGDHYVVQVEEKHGVIHSNFTLDGDASNVRPLLANAGLASRGVIAGHYSYILNPGDSKRLISSDPDLDRYIRRYWTGKDTKAKPRERYMINLRGLTLDELRDSHPTLYKWMHERVRPFREQHTKTAKAANWHLVESANATMWSALEGLSRYIVTSRTAKRHDFMFLDADSIASAANVVIASDDPYLLAVLHSRPHMQWIEDMGGTQGSGRVYIHTTVFDTFPFPEVTAKQKAKIRSLGTRLVAHIDTALKQNPELTRGVITDICHSIRIKHQLNEWEEAFANKAKLFDLAAILDTIDAAVLDAYGMPSDVTDDDITAFLIRLNQTRKVEEETGTIRFVRDDYPLGQTTKRKTGQPSRPHPQFMDN